jgi:hypothetical protein
MLTRRGSSLERIPFDWDTLYFFRSGACPYRKTGVQPRFREGMLFRDMR